MIARAALVAAVLAALAIPPVANAAFPGQNGKITFVRGDDIWTMNPDGTAQVNLTNSAATESNPAWSPDGNRIAFDRAASGNQQIYMMFADGSGATPVTTQFNGNSDPAWSPDGTQLTYVFLGTDIARINIDGTGNTDLAEADAPPIDPEWSPDGSDDRCHRGHVAGLAGMHPRCPDVRCRRRRQPREPHMHGRPILQQLPELVS